MDKKQINEAAKQLSAGAIGVIPTDTIYGISASIANKEAIERVYEETGRPTSKPFIILINDTSQLKDLGIYLTQNQLHLLKKVWPGQTSVVIPVNDKNLGYLHRGKNSLAFRLPKLDWLRNLIQLTGPLIATSANLSGLPTPNNLIEIKRQLPGLDFYYEGKVGKNASRLVLLNQDGSLTPLER